MYYRVTGIFQDIFMDEITEILFYYEALSVSTEYLKKNVVKIIAIFYEIEEAYSFLVQNNFNIEKCDDDQWEDEWYSGYEGGELTENIYITPFDKMYSLDYKYVIKIDPRKAFGDGLHPTTKICALFLEKIVSEKMNKKTTNEKSSESLNENLEIDLSETKVDIPETEIESNKTNEKKTLKEITFIDIGCGTGILSIQASLYGIENIDAIDIEEDAIESSKKNFQLNNISGINLMATDIGVFSVSKKYDIICANLQTAIIEKNIDNIIKLANENSYIIMSGINYIWKDSIMNLFKIKNLKIIDKKRDGEWLGFVLKKDFAT